ncbi:MAG: hypothetical protein KDE61_04995 [Novosphingobium sp.]|nr:hypothetical protein [Novosphingobium sp.]MCP5379697.1 hypothetical protein [Novosphingobium sp.]
MIRSKTVFVVGGGASSELQFPSDAELLARISQSFDFSRIGTEMQTRDGVFLLQNLIKLAQRLSKGEEALRQASERIRIASKLATSIEAIIDQHDNDPLVAACGKLGIAHFICQAEAKSILRDAPRAPGELPIQGEDTWLYQLGLLVTAGVPRSRVEQCLENLAIINFNYDRSVEHFLPHVLVVAFGMSLQEAQRLVAQRLTIVHPFGTVGRLPWQGGENADVEWGREQPWNIQNLAMQIRTPGEVMRDQRALTNIRALVTGAKRLVLLGFGYQPQNVDMLIDYSLSHDPEVLGTLMGVPSSSHESVYKMLRRKTGIEKDDLITLTNAKCNHLMRDFSLLLES